MRIIVIGSGIVGLTAAAELKAAGAAQVTVLEKGEIAGESTSAAAGMLAPQAEAETDNELFQLTCEARDFYPEYVRRLETETSIDVGFDREGTCLVAFSELELETIKERARWQQESGNRSLLSKKRCKKSASVTIPQIFCSEATTMPARL